MADTPDQPNKASETIASNHAASDWQTRHLWQIQPVRDILLLASVVGILYLGYKLSVVTVPMLLAMVLAYLFEPVVQRVTRHRWFSRQGAAALIIISAVLTVIVPATLAVGFGVFQGISFASTVEEQAVDVRRALTAASELGDPFSADEALIYREVWPAGQTDNPDVEPQRVFAGFERLAAQRTADGDADPDLRKVALAGDAAFNELTRPLQSLVGFSIRRISTDSGDSAIAAEVDNFLVWISSNAGTIARMVFGTSLDAAQTLINRVIGLGMLLFSPLPWTGFFFFFFSTGWGRVLEFWEGLIPEAKKGRVMDLVTQMDAVIAAFIRGRITIALVQAVFFMIAYWVIGVPVPVVIGPLIGILSIVPYVSLIGIPITIVGLLISAHAGDPGRVVVDRGGADRGVHDGAVAGRLRADAADPGEADGHGHAVDPVRLDRGRSARGDLRVAAGDPSRRLLEDPASRDLLAPVPRVGGWESRRTSCRSRGSRAHLVDIALDQDGSLGIKQPSLSKLESQTDMQISTLQRGRSAGSPNVCCISWQEFTSRRPLQSQTRYRGGSTLVDLGLWFSKDVAKVPTPVDDPPDLQSFGICIQLVEHQVVGEPGHRHHAQPGQLAHAEVPDWTNMWCLGKPIAELPEPIDQPPRRNNTVRRDVPGDLIEVPLGLR